MSVIEQIQTMKTLVKTNKTLFNSEMQMQHPRKGAIKWVATPDNLENIYGNLKRSIRSKTPLIELEKLFKSIEQNKFATQIKIFTKFYTNPQFNSSDINLGSCPQLDKKIPYNIHKQDKEYFVTLILNWYEKYYLWKQKNKKEKAKIHVEENIEHDKSVELAEPVVREAIPVPEGWQEIIDEQVPDSWDSDSEEGETAIAPDTWEDIVEEDI